MLQRMFGSTTSFETLRTVPYKRNSEGTMMNKSCGVRLVLLYQESDRLDSKDKHCYHTVLVVAHDMIGFDSEE